VNSVIHGKTPLIYAAELGHLEMVKSLLASDALVDLADATTGQTPLYVAAMLGFPLVVDHLFACEADINKANMVGCTPLYAAAEQGRIEVSECQ
jgi:ankyrin repeat protein